MSKKTCVVCSRVKGKRVCRIQADALICPRCCARIRNSNCQGCPYYSQAQRYTEQKARLSKAPDFTMRIDPDVDEAVDRALAMIESGNNLQGETIIADLFDKHPDLHTVQFGMGVALAMKGKYGESIAYFDKTIEIFPYFVEGWFNKGMSHQKQLEPEKAIRAFQKVMELGDPAEGFVRHASDFVNDIEKRLREKDGLTLDDYLKANDTFDEAFSAMQAKNWQRAIDGFRAAIALSPNHPQSYGNMGICYAQLGRRQEALVALDKALEIDPHYEPASLNRKIVLSLGEGEKLANDRVTSVEYQKDYALKNKSLLDRFGGMFRR